MFTRTSRALKYFDLVCFKSQRTFTSQSSPSSIALEKISESMKSTNEKAFKDLLILDKLNETTYSNTFRALNKETKSFFSYKTININSDSTSAWNQIELLLKQHNLNSLSEQNSPLINYDKNAGKVQVLTEMQKTTLGDFSEFYLKNHGQFSSEILTEYSWQLFELLYRTRALDAVCYDLSLQNIFIDYKDNRLNFHDYSDLRYLTDFYSEFKSFQAPYYLDIVLHSIAKMTSPSVTMSSPHHARNYLKEHFPQFMREFKEVEEFASQVKTWLPYDPNNSNNDRILFELESRTEKSLPFSEGYNKFLAEKIKTVMKINNSDEESIKNWKLVEKAISQSVHDLHSHVKQLKAMKEHWQGQALYYKGIGDFEKSCDCFDKMLRVSQSIEIMEKFQADGCKQELGSKRTVEVKPDSSKFKKILLNLCSMTLGVLLCWGVIVGGDLAFRDQVKTPVASGGGNKKEGVKQETENGSNVKTIGVDEKKKQSIQLMKFGIIALLASVGLTLY